MFEQVKNIVSKYKETKNLKKSYLENFENFDKVSDILIQRHQLYRYLRKISLMNVQRKKSNEC